MIRPIGSNYPATFTEWRVYAMAQKVNIVLDDDIDGSDGDRDGRRSGSTARRTRST